MQDVHQLALIFVKPFYLYVKDGTRIHVNPVVFLNVFCQADLVLVLDIHELLPALFIVRINLQLLDMGKIGNPLIPDFGGHPVSKQGISMKQEPSLGNAVGLVVELLRHHLVEIL